MNRFTKMHGAGNDFVVLDLRGDAPDPSAEWCQAISDRHTGAGCDLILGIKAPRSAASIASFAIWTATGASSPQCGNGARCVAAWLVREGVATGPEFCIDSPSGTLTVEAIDKANFRVSMGVPQFAADRIPVALSCADDGRYTVELADQRSVRFAAVSMGNPHAVIEVKDVAQAPVQEVGLALRAGPWLPLAINVGFAEIVSRQHIRLRVHEYGAGETLACGSGACAAAATFIRDGLIDRQVRVSLPGGDLGICWPDDTSPITMAGPAAFVYEGQFHHASL
ncbi:diaminopimelate epimerase [Roseateles sp. DB2]|uniref:diaminopimelate epimerase n=1 Tax=Roseateles sp. DB2 TaxID=3453717 RepID=UPI003EED87A0